MTSDNFIKLVCHVTAAVDAIDEIHTLSRDQKKAAVVTRVGKKVGRMVYWQRRLVESLANEYREFKNMSWEV